MIGKIKSIDMNNGSGVITSSQTGKDIPFSFPAVASNNYKLLHQGQKVQFYVQQGSQSNENMVATKVTAVD